jgi:hypothetical protein
VLLRLRQPGFLYGRVIAHGNKSSKVLLTKLRSYALAKLMSIRHTLRSVRDRNPARREVLVTLMELKKLWINAEQCGSLKSAWDSIRRSRRDYKNGGELRELMLREKKAKGAG